MLTTRLRVYVALGLWNCARIALYRVAVRAGFFRWRTPSGEAYSIGECYADAPDSIDAPPVATAQAVMLAADRLLDGRILYFERHSHAVGSPPDWFLNPFDGQVERSQRSHWSTIDDFGRGDIKVIWEPSRFHWSVTLAQAYRLSRDRRYLYTLDQWLNDWIAENPANMGPNWKSGQEVAIRLINLLLVTHLLAMPADRCSKLVRFVREHLLRIEATLGYALGQDNNHATSETAALLIGGQWLLAQGVVRSDERLARRCAVRGRFWLEERIRRLVAPDGSFSQYSVNYHRLLLDTTSLIQWWCRELDVEGLGVRSSRRIRKAIDWLASVVDETSGDAPNIGGNDGARLISFHAGDFRDHRPSLQLAAALFNGRRVYGDGPWDDACLWLSIDPRKLSRMGMPTGSREFPDGGYALFVAANRHTHGILRFPKFRFRPSHADAMHLDIWMAGVNLTRDSGTFSYNCGEPWLSYFSSTSAHCTCEFDGRDQMPRLSRFLFGDWLQTTVHAHMSERADGEVRWSGEYRDAAGARHKRSVGLRGGVWFIRDELSGFLQKAVLRWRLAPDDWHLERNCALSGVARLHVESDPPPRRIELLTGWESRYYLERTSLPVLEVELAPGSATVETRIEPATA